MNAVKCYAQRFVMLLGLLFGHAACSAKNDYPMQPSPVSFEAIADLNSVQEAEAWAKRNGLHCVNETNHEMEVQRTPELSDSKRFGAEGRLWIIVNLRNNSISVHINLFYSKTGGIAGRLIMIENLYE